MKEKHPIDSIYKKLEDSSQENIPGKDRIWNQIASQLDEESNKTTPWVFKKSWAVAASFLVLGVLGVLWYNQSNSDHSVEPIVYESNASNREINKTGVEKEAATAVEEKAKIEAEYADMLEPKDSRKIYAIETKKDINENLFENKKSIEPSQDEIGNTIKTIEDTLESNYKYKESAKTVNEDAGVAKERAVIQPENRMNTEYKSQDKLEWEESIEAAPILTAPTPSRNKEKDFYFVDGRQVTQEELATYDAADLNSITYLENDEAPAYGYIQFYKNQAQEKKGKVEKIVFWKSIKANKVKKEEASSVISQLNAINTSQMSEEDKKELKLLIESIENRFK